MNFVYYKVLKNLHKITCHIACAWAQSFKPKISLIHFYFNHSVAIPWSACLLSKDFNFYPNILFIPIFYQICLDNSPPHPHNLPMQLHKLTGVLLLKQPNKYPIERSLSTFKWGNHKRLSAKGNMIEKEAKEIINST